MVATQPDRAAVAAPLLSVEDLTVRIGRKTLVDCVSLEVARGEVVGLVGPNGAGKSTLLRAISGVQSTAAGEVRIEGRSAVALGRRELAKRLAVVQQLPEAPSAMLVSELVLLGRHPHLGWFDRESGRDARIARLAMSRAGCLELADREVGTLSGGERRRAFIARALAQEAELLLLDEPTANLDAGAQAEVCDLLRTLASDDVGVLVVLHDLTLAASTCDRVILLAEGRVVATGSPDEVITAEHVARMYGPGVAVLRHPEDGRPIVVPALGSRR
ncbi:MAG: ABC transporter ATP-binding protein [Chloroflexi bacterium]|nr:ABC transporter ATP-binding protein [Chloroflexota bacterium]MDA1147610.1 ABC transporter ATP-binding protein [Chloroflexota bacterium]